MKKLSKIMIYNKKTHKNKTRLVLVQYENVLENLKKDVKKNMMPH